MASNFNNFHLPLLLLLLSPPLRCTSAASLAGATYVYFPGRSSAPPPNQVVPFLLQSLPSLTRIRLLNPSPDTVRAFSYSDIALLLSLPNSLIPTLASNRSSAAAQWLADHVLPFYPRARIATISVGNNLLSDSPDLSAYILPAVTNLFRALRSSGIRKISVSATLSFDIIKSPFPPSEAHFDESVSQSVIKPLLDFLSGANSSFLINLYPYDFYRSTAEMPIGFALFQEKQPFNYREDPSTGLRYRNLFDAMVDAVITAMAVLGHEHIPVVVAETGWPSGGDANEAGAKELYAGAYLDGLVRHLRSDAGTPLRREGPAETYIFELFDEEPRQGPGSERHWGMLYRNMTSKHGIDFSGFASVYSRSMVGLVTWFWVMTMASM